MIELYACKRCLSARDLKGADRIVDWLNSPFSSSYARGGDCRGPGKRRPHRRISLAAGGTWPSIIIAHQPHAVHHPAGQHAVVHTIAPQRLIARTKQLRRTCGNIGGSEFGIISHSQPSNRVVPSATNSSACQRTIAYLRWLISIWHAAQLPRVENTTKQEIKLLWILCFYFYSETQPIEDERQ